MVLANITESAYFRCDLLQIKTYDDMIDEIYYKVTHLEPWEKVGKYSTRSDQSKLDSRDRESILPAARRVLKEEWRIPAFLEFRIMLESEESVKEALFPPPFAACINFGR